jgi:hypothetical protein
MPRPKKPPRLYLRSRPGAPSYWVVVDGKSEFGTGALGPDLARAEEALRRYLVERHEPPRTTHPEQLLVSEILDAYLREHASRSPSRQWITHMATPLAEWWAGKAVAEVNRLTCARYTDWRMGQQHRRSKAPKQISDQTPVTS